MKRRLRNALTRPVKNRRARRARIRAAIAYHQERIAMELGGQQ